MPQKRNPYALVVLRGGAGTLIGRATGVLATQRTPSGRTDNLLYAYGEVAGAVDLAARLLRLAAAVAESLTFDGERAERVLRESGAMATDVAEAISLADRPSTTARRTARSGATSKPRRAKCPRRSTRPPPSPPAPCRAAPRPSRWTRCSPAAATRSPARGRGSQHERDAIEQAEQQLVALARALP